MKGGKCSKISLCSFCPLLSGIVVLFLHISLSLSLFSHCLTFSSSAKTLILIEIAIGTYTNRAKPWTVIPLGVLVSLPPPGATNRLSNLDQVRLLYFPQFNSFPLFRRFHLVLRGFCQTEF